MDAIDEAMQSRIFVSSISLDPEAIVEFFQALTTVSCEELAGKPSARVFALSKIVDVCHHNIDRPRIVWTAIWKGIQAPVGDQKPWRGLSEYFVDIGCHANLQVAMFAMDALRQVGLLPHDLPQASPLTTALPGKFWHGRLQALREQVACQTGACCFVCACAPGRVAGSGLVHCWHHLPDHTPPKWNHHSLASPVSQLVLLPRAAHAPGVPQGGRKSRGQQVTVVQIAEKFLERPELANMSFQNDFLKPFVVVMRQSGAKEIRELIIRQVSRMVLSQVANIKSGWKSMFMVLFCLPRAVPLLASEPCRSCPPVRFPRRKPVSSSV
jgi:hypothetical protein